jgi:DNA-binding winged helix-turn-helix (wHTH) protein
MPEHQDRYEFGGFQLDVRRRLVQRADGSQIAVTPKAFDTLLHLIENRGSIVTKEALMKAVWPDTVVEENNLNQNISALRRALGESRNENRYIATLPSRGYRFVAPVRVLGPNETNVSSAALKTLAVLPFKPLMEASSDASLELGMADTLIARLSTIRELVVRPMSSVRNFNRSDQDPLLVGRQLGVESVLEGTLQKYESKVRVSARLLNIADGKALWAGTFDEPFTDIFLLQDSIAEKVVKALELRLNPVDMDRLTKRHTSSTEAYRLYLKGRFYWWNTDPNEFKKSREYFHRAVDADPEYALGYCGLNSFYGFSAAWGVVPPDEGWAKAAWAMLRALELDDTLAEAHLGNAAYKMVHRDWDGAEAEAKRGIELNPSFDEIHYFYSFLLAMMGRFDEAIVAAQRALDCNPFSARINLHVGNTFVYAGRLREAVDQYKQAIELNPKDAPTHEALGDALEEMKDHSGAVAAWLRAAELSGDVEIASILRTSSKLGFDGVVQSVAKTKLQRLKTMVENGGYVPSAHFLKLYLRSGDKKRALTYLEDARKERNVFSLLIERDPQLVGLR